MSSEQSVRSSAPYDLVVIGTGYIGYPLALLAADAGLRVLAVDTDLRVVDHVMNGKPVYDEPGLESLAAKEQVRTYLSASDSPDRGKVFAIAVPTPVTDAGGVQADLSYLRAAVASIVPFVSPGNLVIVESTVPPGTTLEVVAPILESGGLQVGRDVLLAFCPERLFPGSALVELKSNPRIVGGVDGRSSEAAESFYDSFLDVPIVTSNVQTAELCKLLENTFRDTNIALANDMARVCEDAGVDPMQALDLANRHPRVNYLMPGIGVGGHCIAVDPWFLSNGDGSPASIVVTARLINRHRETIVFRRIAELLHDSESSTVTVAGIAYKPNVSDTRESPALRIVEMLKNQGWIVRVFDPVVDPTQRNDDLAAFDGSDLLVVLVPHEEVVTFLSNNEGRIRGVMRRDVIVDLSTGQAREFF